jgi:hypothetical protein
MDQSEPNNKPFYINPESLILNPRTVVSDLLECTRQKYYAGSTGIPVGLYTQPGASDSKHHQIEISEQVISAALRAIPIVVDNQQKEPVDFGLQRLRDRILLKLKQMYIHYSRNELFQERWRQFLRDVTLAHEYTHKYQQDRAKLADTLDSAMLTTGSFITSREVADPLAKDLVTLLSLVEAQAYISSFRVPPGSNLDKRTVGDVALLLGVASHSMYGLYKENLMYVFEKYRDLSQLTIGKCLEMHIQNVLANIIILTRNPHVLEQFLSGELSEEQIQRDLVAGWKVFLSRPDQFIDSLSDRAFLIDLDQTMLSAQQKMLR